MTWAGMRSQKAATRAAGRWVPVGLFGLQTIDQLGRGGHLGRHRVEVVDVALGERHADLARAGQRRQVRVHREGGPGVEDLGAGLAERLGGGEQDLAGAVADGDPAGLGLVAIGDAAAQQGRVGIGVAVHRARRLADRLDHLRVRREGRLVRGELGDPAGGDRLGRLPGRHAGLVARHAGELLGEGDGHRAHCADRATATGRRGGRRAAPGSRRGRRGPACARPARSSGPSPGSPAASSPAPGSPGSRAAAPRRARGSRAATAGNSASRSSVVVNRQLTIASGLQLVALEQLAHQLGRRREDRLGLVGLRLHGAAHREEPLLFARVSAHDPASSQSEAISSSERRRGLPSASVAKLDRAEADAPQRDHLVADRFGHPAHLAVAALAQDDLDLPLAQPPHLGRRGRAVLELDPARPAAAGRPRPAAAAARTR